MIYQAPPTPPAIHSFLIASARNAAQRELDKVMYDSYISADGLAVLIIRNASKQEIDAVAKLRKATKIEYFKNSNGSFTGKVYIRD